MANQPAKRRVQGGSGRVTPKGGAKPQARAPEASARYTPPVPKELKVSPWWVPAVMFALPHGGEINPDRAQQR